MQRDQLVLHSLSLQNFGKRFVALHNHRTGTRGTLITRNGVHCIIAWYR